MDRIQELENIVAQFDLNNHPFYQDWAMGTLPVEKLQEYAAEYGHFVGTIAKGWETIGVQKFADEERVHEGLWADFANAIGSKKLNALTTQTLVTSANNLFSVPDQAVGALFAFEAQQPITSQTKLDGLNKHYAIDEKGKEYFVVHANDFDEVELLKNCVAEMSDEEFAQTKAACAVICAAMWGALDGIYYAKQVANA